MSTSYAHLTAAAKKAGGSSKLIDDLAAAAKKAGKQEAWAEALAIFGTVTAAAVAAGISYLKHREATSRDEIKAAKRGLGGNTDDVDTRDEDDVDEAEIYPDDVEVDNGTGVRKSISITKKDSSDWLSAMLGRC